MIGVINVKNMMSTGAANMNDFNNSIEHQIELNNSEEEERFKQAMKLLSHAITLLSEVRGQHKACEYIEDALREMSK